MTAGDVDKAQWCCALAVYAMALRRKETVKPAAVRVESLAFPVPEGFDYSDFLAAVNKELRRYGTELHASACLQSWQSGRIVRITHT